MPNDYKSVVDMLVKDNTILEGIADTTEVENLSYDEVVKILDASYQLVYDEDNDILSYVDEDGDTHVAPDLSIGMSASAEWLCDKLPELMFDCEQGGNLRKAQEARSCYKLICIGIVFDTWKSELKRVFKEYDFVDLKFISNNASYGSMTEYLEEFMDLNSLRINSVVSSASIRISRAIEKKDIYWKSQLTREEIIELGRVSRNTKNVILRFEREEGLNPEEIQTKSKIDKLTTIDERDRECDRIIDASPIAKIYRIIKFNSERLLPVTKRKILTKSKDVARYVTESKGLTGQRADECYESEFREVYKKLTRMAVITLRSKELSKYKEDPEGYKLIKKI